VSSISAEAAAIKQSIEPEPVDPSSTVESDRQAWLDAVADVPLVAGTAERVEVIAGVPCRWISPHMDEDFPTIVYGHGGGLTAGSSATSREFASRLAVATCCHVLLVDYRLLPEHDIADPIADVVAVYRWLVGHSGVTAERIFVGGDSSGAALMVSALVALRDSGDPLPAALISFSGAFDATLSSPSIDEGRDPQLHRAALEHWQDVIRPVVALDDHRLSPIFTDLRQMPPMLLLAGGDDAWRDDSVRLAERLAKSGGSVELHVAAGMWHVWPVWGSFPESDAALARIATFLRTHIR
jgi:epsilon-lactone hydrolase